MGFESVYCYFYIINYTLGSGFLSLPYIFYKAGILTTTLGFTFYCTFALISAFYVLEFLGRVKVIDQAQLSKSENETLLPIKTNNRDKYYHSKDRKYEVTEVGQILGGYWINVLLTLILTCSCLTSLSAYASVSASTLAINIPVNLSNIQTCDAHQFMSIIPTYIPCLNFYRLFVGAFGIIVIILSVLGLDKQKYLQLFMGIMRFLLITSLFLFSLLKLIMDQVDPSILYISNAHNSSQSSYVDILFNSDLLYTFYGIPIFLYTLQNHYFLPTALFTVKNKRVLKQIILAVFSTLGVTLVFLSISISLAFGDDSNPNCVLNWLPYTHPQHNIALRVFSYVVIFFPVIDLVSCYPLTSILVSNLLFQMVFRRDTSQINTLTQKLIVLSFRFFVAFFPLLLGIFIANLILLNDLSGLFSIALCLLVPVLFQFRSQILIKRIGDLSYGSSRIPIKKCYTRVKHLLFSLRSPTPYSGWYSGLFAQIFVSVLAIITLFVCTASVIFQCTI